MRNKLFKITLLFTWLMSSVALAKYPEQNDFLENTRIAVDFGFGLPTGVVFREVVKEGLNASNTNASIKVSPNINFGILASYNFPITDTFSMAPEVGVSYGFTRRLQIDPQGAAFEEKHINFPLSIRMKSSSESSTFLVSNSFVVGYDFNVFLSSSYKYEGNYPKVDSTFLSSQDDLYKFITDLPRVSGSIVIGDDVEFLKGFYLSAKIKLPMDFFTILKNKSDNKKEALNATHMQTIRLLTANLLEFSIGLDIMRLI